MGKVRYKEPSKNFVDSVARSSELGNRSSIGQENHVGEFYYLSINLLLPYAKQARRNFDLKQIEELAVTIKEHGIQNPLLVTPSREIPDKFEVISGERRLRAAKLINLEKVPCTIINGDKAEEIALIENIQRADLHPVEIGDSILSMMGDSKWGDVNKIAEKIGKDQSTVSHYLSYAQLPKKIKDYLVENNIRSREILRRIVKEKHENDMMSLISKRKIEGLSKSVIRISLDDGLFKIQDKALSALDEENLLSLREKITGILSKIDGLLK